jgi:septum formation protein
VSAPRLILASASPRRRGLLRAIGVHVHAVTPADIAEVPEEGEAPVAYAHRLARQKAAHVAAQAGADMVVLAADTVVHFDGRIFEKPVDDPDAARILHELSGREHGVTTGWCVARVGHAAVSGTVTAKVRFRSLSPAMVAAYVATGEGRDKAGAYGVQGLGAALVGEVTGSTSTVVGLPMDAVLTALADVGVHPSLPSETL